MVVMEEQLNYVGAFIFWLYIVAALAFTFTVLWTIVKLPTSPSRTSSHDWRQVQIYSILALISFATLSFNMLHVLIQSFRLWSLGHNYQPGLNDILLLLRNIYHWSTTSTLFSDFAGAIVESNARFVWTLSALAMTLLQCFDMAFLGKERNVPNLWAFFALAQILPISFAQNLFYIALLRLTPQARIPEPESESTSEPKSKSTTIPGSSLAPNAAPLVPHPPVHRLRAVARKLHAILLIAAVAPTLHAAPFSPSSNSSSRNHSNHSNDGTGFSPLQHIAIARILMLLPLALVRVRRVADAEFDDRWAARKWTGRGGVATTLGTYAAVALAFRLFQVRSEGERDGDVGMALWAHPAVTTLGMDVVLSAGSYGLWWGWGGERRTDGVPRHG